MPGPGLPRADITGLVLAGGEGRRMGGQDKGLLLLQGQPLAQRALARLAPQVGPLAISANRHLDQYAAWGHPVWPDDAVFTSEAGAEAEGTATRHHGPLAGLATALARASTPWLAAVPCDSPAFPPDLVAQLAALATAQGVALVHAAAPGPDGQWRDQPLFCLLHQRCLPSLRQALSQRERKVLLWMHAQAHAVWRCEDGAAFANLNTPEALRAGAG